jgi:hypothetical protein
VLVDATAVEYIEAFTVKVWFDTGESGTIDLNEVAQSGGVFEPLEDVEYFKKVFVHPEFKVLTWPNGADLAPEFVYSEATGKPLPKWMVNTK